MWKTRDASTETTYASLASRILRVSCVFVYFFLVCLSQLETPRSLLLLPHKRFQSFIRNICSKGFSRLRNDHLSQKKKSKNVHLQNYARLDCFYRYRVISKHLERYIWGIGDHNYKWKSCFGNKQTKNETNTKDNKKGKRTTRDNGLHLLTNN